MKIRGLTKIKDVRGASAIEFAIILPLLVPLVFGIIEFSILWYDQAMITNASREGARTGIVFFTNPDGTNHPSDSDIINIVDRYCRKYLITFDATSDPNTTLNTTISRTGETGDSSGDFVTVTVRYQVDSFVLPNFVAGLIGFNLLAAETVMRME